MYAPVKKPAWSSSHDRLAEWLLFGQIIGVTFLQKFAVPVGGGTQIFFGLLVILGLTGLGLLTQRLQVNKSRLILYAAMIGGLTLTQLIGQQSFSIPSLLLLTLVHAPYAFQLKPGQAQAGVELQFYQKVCLILAALALIQYPLQFVTGPNIAFFLDSLFPQAFIMQGFHGMNALSYGASVYKSNGLFMLEPALLCQFLAVAIVIEVIYFRKIWRLGVYLAAIAVTFSGTGLLILFALAPVYLLQKRQFLLLFLLVAAVLTANMWAPYVGLGMLVERSAEFTDTNSSGYARFISIFRILDDFILHQTDTLLFGLGAGSIMKMAVTGQTDYVAFDPSWGKVVFEFGIVGAVVYLVFMLYVFMSPQRSGYLKAALLLQYMFLGGYVLPPTVHGLLLALLAWPAAEEADFGANSRKHFPADNGKSMNYRRAAPSAAFNYVLTFKRRLARIYKTNDF